MIIISGAAGGPHLLLQGPQAVLRPPPRRDPQAALLRLRRGEPGHSGSGQAVMLRDFYYIVSS